MSEEKQVSIREKSKTYDIKYEYHSDALCENFDAEILAIEEANGKITLRPHNGEWNTFLFDHSDPDRVIAIADMIKAFAKMAKKNYTNSIDAQEKA